MLAVTANAQIFVGGTLGLRTTSDDKEGMYTISVFDVNDYKTTDFQFKPRIGYQVSEELSVGLDINFVMSAKKGKFKEVSTDKYLDVKDSRNLFGADVFARYNAISFGNFNVGVEGKLGFAADGSKTSELDMNSSGEYVIKDKDGTKHSYFGIGIAPVVSYDLNENFQIFTYLNFLKVGFLSHTEKTEIGTKTETTKSSVFNFGVDTNDIMTVGAIQVGFVYKF